MTKTGPMTFEDFAEMIMRMNEGRPQPEQLNSGGTWGPVQPPLGDVQQFRMFKDSQADPAFPIVQRNFAADPTQPTLVFDDSMLPPPPATQPPQRSFLDFNSPQAQPYSLPAEQGFRAMKPLTPAEKVLATAGSESALSGGANNITDGMLNTAQGATGKVSFLPQGNLRDRVFEQEYQNAADPESQYAAMNGYFGLAATANLNETELLKRQNHPAYQVWVMMTMMRAQQSMQGGMGANQAIANLAKAQQVLGKDIQHVNLSDQSFSKESTTSVRAAEEKNRGAKDRQTTDLQFKREQNAAKHGHEMKMRKMDNAVKWLEMQMESGDQDAKRQYAMMKAKTEPLYMQIDALYDEFSNTRNPDRKAEIQNQINAYHTRIATILRNFELSLEKTNKGLFDDYTEFAKFGESAE